MSLESIKLDRFLYRTKNGNPNTPMQGITTDVPDGISYDSEMGGGGGTTPAEPTGGITGTPGGIIAQMFLRSSNGPNRVEINPNDTFIAYEDNVPVITINKDGINIAGSNLPQVFTGSLDSAGTALYLPTGWTCTRLSLGTYEVTHTFTVGIWYSVTVTPITGHYRGKIASFGPTSFTVTFQESQYAAGLYTGETLVDTDFNFIVANVL